MAGNSKAASRSKQSGSRSSRSGSSRPSGGASRTKSAAATRTRSSAARAQSAKRSAQTRSNAIASDGSRSSNGVVGTIKETALKAKGPAVAVGATAVGVAGGMILRDRMRRKTVLGIPLPRSGVMPSDRDVRSVAKSLGKASKQFGQATKSVSKDMERVGDQAERFGKFLD
jgi:hypothetical protein